MENCSDSWVIEWVSKWPGIGSAPPPPLPLPCSLNLHGMVPHNYCLLQWMTQNINVVGISINVLEIPVCDVAFPENKLIEIYS